MSNIRKFISLTLVYILIGCFSVAQASAPKRIVSLSGSLTEIVDALGLGANLVAVDVTSDFPNYVKDIAKVSKNRSVTAEAVASFRPDMVLGIEAEVNAALVSQLKKLNIPVVLFKQEYTASNLIDMVRKVGAALDMSSKGNQVANQLALDIKNASAKVKTKNAVKTMFVYARGAGAMSVSGTETAVHAVITLAGGQNAMKGFTGYKTYNTEALVKANPDAIMLFDFGASSLGGKDGILKLPGVALTNAGKNQRIITMDATLLNNFSMRLPLAITQLNEKLYGRN